MPDEESSLQPFGEKKGRKVYDACPHCGKELSPWEQVLLSVDRALMCKHCWYRIILDAFEDEGKRRGKEPSQSKDSKP